MNKEDIIINLEKHETRDVKDEHTNGTLTVVWRDWDKVILEEPKMVYVSTINPGEIKGPHLHKKRNSYFSCIHGKVTFIIKNDDGEYLEIETNADEPILLRIPNGIASAHINTTNEIGRVLAIADIAWKPNDNEMVNVEFENYNWNKWK